MAEESLKLSPEKIKAAAQEIEEADARALEIAQEAAEAAAKAAAQPSAGNTPAGAPPVVESPNFTEAANLYFRDIQEAEQKAADTAATPEADSTPAVPSAEVASVTNTRGSSPFGSENTPGQKLALKFNSLTAQQQTQFLTVLKLLDKKDNFKQAEFFHYANSGVTEDGVAYYNKVIDAISKDGFDLSSNSQKDMIELTILKNASTINNILGDGVAENGSINLQKIRDNQEHILDNAVKLISEKKDDIAKVMDALPEVVTKSPELKKLTESAAKLISGSSDEQIKSNLRNAIDELEKRAGEDKIINGAEVAQILSDAKEGKLNLLSDVQGKNSTEPLTRSFGDSVDSGASVEKPKPEASSVAASTSQQAGGDVSRAAVADFASSVSNVNLLYDNLPEHKKAQIRQLFEGQDPKEVFDPNKGLDYKKFDAVATKAYKIVLDENNNGNVTASEIKRFFSQDPKYKDLVEKTPEHELQKFADSINSSRPSGFLYKADINKDGYLSKDEVLKAQNYAPQTSPRIGIGASGKHTNALKQDLELLGIHTGGAGTSLTQSEFAQVARIAPQSIETMSNGALGINPAKIRQVINEKIDATLYKADGKGLTNFANGEVTPEELAKLSAKDKEFLQRTGLNLEQKYTEKKPPKAEVMPEEPEFGHRPALKAPKAEVVPEVAEPKHRHKTNQKGNDIAANLANNPKAAAILERFDGKGLANFANDEINTDEMKRAIAAAKSDPAVAYALDAIGIPKDNKGNFIKPTEVHLQLPQQTNAKQH